MFHHRFMQFLFLLCTALPAYSQVPQSDELFRTLKAKDSLLFDIGFNTCEISQFEKILSDDFQFYHDQAGLTNSKSDFISSVRKNICALEYKPERRLVEGTVEVFPLKNNEVLYGAIQTGTHNFFANSKENGRSMTSIAKFTHIWTLENKEWKLSKVFSYDHKEPERLIDEKLLFSDQIETERWMKLRRIPALGIGIIADGKIQQIKVFGNLVKDKPAPTNTLWNVASLTKPVTALVALKLVEMGQWSLDEPISKYYTDSDVAQEPFAKKLTTRIILSHQTGFPNWRSKSTNGKLAFEFEPGTKFQYSGEGYEYLRKALEKKIKKPFHYLAQELIFKPLQMNDTQFFWDSTTDESRFAQWHNGTGDVYKTYKNTTSNAADDLLTTVEDYSKFMLHVLKGGGLSAKLNNEISAKQVKINNYKHFGLGWWIDNNINGNGDFAMVHGGDDIGLHTIAFIVPKTQRGLLIFTNCDNGTDVFAEILVRFLGKDGQGILDIEMKK